VLDLLLQELSGDSAEAFLGIGDEEGTFEREPTDE
jgi:hypothetical protein